MIKRIIDISEPAYLHQKNKQLYIDKKDKTVGTIPIEDLGVLILQHPAIVITQALVISCQKNNVVVIFCDERHLPFSILLPISEGNTLHSKVLREQIKAKLTTKKSMWQQIVKLKISEQIRILKFFGKEPKSLARIVKNVKSGDPQNCEAQAAKIYWAELMGPGFKRDTNAEGINALLNYGYAIMRATIARAIVSGGLHPTLGLHHHNQYNGLCLADDLMEPFRPWVDKLVFEIIKEDGSALVTQYTKQILLDLISANVKWDDKNMPLMVATNYLVANIKNAHADNKIKIVYPILQLK
jgi:CRISP-associated protein Cas1